MPHKRKQPDTDTDGDPVSAVPRVLVRHKIGGGRAFNGPGGWFPRADVPYGTMREFPGASKSSKPPASEADLKVARQAVVDAWRKVESRHCHLRPPAVAADDVVHILHLRVVSEDLAPLHAPQQLCRREHRATTQLTHAPQRPGAT